MPLLASRGFAAFVLATYLTTLSYPALAQSESHDAVFLNDDNVIRGTLREVVAGDHVTVQLPNGQMARVLWSFVRRIEHDGQPVVINQRGTPAPSAPPPPVAVQTAAPAVIVHIEGESVRMEQKIGKRDWQEVCSAPCDRALPLGETYRIVGDGIRSTRQFALMGNPGDHVVLTVDTASKGAFVGGIVLMGVSMLSLGIGVILVLVGALDDSAGNSSDGNGARTAGYVALGLGGAGMLTGILLTTGNASSKLEQTLASPQTNPQVSAWLRGGRMDGRLPVFHQDVMSAGIPRAPVVPIFSGRF